MLDRVSLLLFYALAPQGADVPATVGESAEDIVVTRSLSRTPPDPVVIFREHCFDSNRRTGIAALPAQGSGWHPLDSEMRQARKVPAAAAAFEKTDRGFNLAMMLEFEERPYHGRLIQHRCTLKTFGSPDPSRQVDGISGFFGGAGSRNHLSHDPEEMALPGWTQWRWTGAPVPSSEQWRVYSSGGLLFVTQDFFYDTKSYVVVDLKFSTDPRRPASVMTLVHIFDPKVFCRPSSRRGSARCSGQQPSLANAR